MYVAYVLNLLYNGQIKSTPKQKLTGVTPDISAALCFQWFEPVYYKSYTENFPSESTEERGRFVGIADHVGHALTFKILSDKTGKVVYRSEVRSALKEQGLNLRLDPLDGETVKEYIRSKIKSCVSQDNGQASPMHIIHYKDLVGRTFLQDKENGEIHRTRIVECLDNLDSH